MNDLRVELRTRNNVLWHAIFDTCESVAAFCRLHNFQQTVVGGYLNLTLRPYLKAGSVSPCAQAICDAVKMIAEDLFPPTLYRNMLPPRMAFELDSERFVALSAARRLALPPAQDTAIFEDERRHLLNAALKTLTRRQETVIRHRFGLNGDEAATLTDTAIVLGVSRERARQIEYSALRKLRHPSNSRPLRSVLDGMEERTGERT